MNLKFDLTQNGAKYNYPTKIISASCDEDLTSANLNNVLPNNSTNFNKDIGILNTGSQIIVMCNSYAVACIFDAGVSKDGIWKIISKIPFVTV